MIYESWKKKGVPVPCTSTRDRTSIIQESSSPLIFNTSTGL
jgi:hypothetical protein